jgi:hypothetical protein
MVVVWVDTVETVFCSVSVVDIANGKTSFLCLMLPASCLSNGDWLVLWFVLRSFKGFNECMFNVHTWRWLVSDDVWLSLRQFLDIFLSSYVLFRLRASGRFGNIPRRPAKWELSQLLAVLLDTSCGGDYPFPGLMIGDRSSKIEFLAVHLAKLFLAFRIPHSSVSIRHCGDVSDHYGFPSWLPNSVVQGIGIFFV